VLPITSMMNTMMAARRTGSNQAYSGGKIMFSTLQPLSLTQAQFGLCQSKRDGRLKSCPCGRRCWEEGRS
jgi:hypothetical protein